MKLLLRINVVLGALAVAALLPMKLDAQSRPTFIGNPNLVRDTAPELNPVTDADVTRVVHDAINGLDLAEQAGLAGIRIDSGRLLLEVSARAPDSADDAGSSLAGLLIDFDARVLNARAPNRCIAYIAPELVPELEEALMVKFSQPRIRAFRAPVANAYDEAGSEGVAAMRTGLYGLSGENATVAVFDLGFTGLEPAHLDKVYVINDNGSSGESHGAAMVEIIRRVAPEAAILAYRIDENLDIESATADAIRQGADVIISALSDFDLPGFSPADQAARLAVSSGLQWVNAAGNFGDGRYFESEQPDLVDLSGDTFIAFDPADPYQYIEGAVHEIRLHFMQERLDADDAQVSLELYSWDGMTSNLQLEALGNHNHRVQTLIHSIEPGKYYFPMLRLAVDGNLRRFRMFSETGRLHFSSQLGSIANPGGIEGIVTVGAVNVASYGPGAEVEAYSGRGGGVFDLRLELCGPSHCTSGIYGPQGFTGTSAAAAHIGGLIALHLSDEGLVKDPVGMIRSIDIHEPGEDAVSGRGLAMAQVDDAEPDNSRDSATNLMDVGQSVAGRSLSPSHDQDWFSFELTEHMSARLTVAGEPRDISMFVESEENNGLENLDGLDHPVLNPGRYFVRVSGGLCLDYALNLELSQEPPSAVTGLYPADGEEVLGIRGENELTSVRLSWDEVVGIGLIMYRVQVLEADNPRVIVADMTTIGNSMEVVGLGFDKGYLWTVQSMNEHGESEPSAEQLFFIAPGEAAGQVIEMSPGDDTEVGGIQQEDGYAAVSLRWQPVQGDGLIMYQVQVLSSDQDGPVADMTTVGTEMTIHGLKFGAGYTWQVRAFSEYGSAPFSGLHAFVISHALEQQAITSDAVLGPDSPQVDEQAAGCAGNSGSKGMILLLVAIVAAAGMTKRKRNRTEA